MSAHAPAHAARAAVRWSPARVAAGAVLAAWAVLFWFLILSERSLLYVSTRTKWVVPVGAIVMTAAAIGRLASARSADPKPIARREAWVLGLMIVPVVVVLALPPTSLGSFSLSRRSSFVRTGVTVSAEDIASGPLTLVDIASSPVTELGRKALAQRAGEQVTFDGFVAVYPDTPSDEFLLTRYVITCCVADATTAQVRVVNVTPGQFAEDDWVRVSGTFYPLGDVVIVDASRITKIQRPKNPYLTP